MKHHTSQGQGIQGSEATYHEGRGRETETGMGGSEIENSQGITGDYTAGEVEVIVGGDVEVELLNLVANGGAEEGVETGEG